MSERPGPPVTVTRGGPAWELGPASGALRRGARPLPDPLRDDAPPATDDDPPVRRRRGPWWPVAVLVAVVVAGVGSGLASPGPRAPKPVFDAVIEPPRELASSSTGVLVVPVEVVNRGARLRILTTRLHASPVRQDPKAAGASRVEAQATRRVLAILQPDCRLLRPGTGVGFDATLQVVVELDDGARRDLLVDLGRAPVVVDWIADLCAPAGT